MYNFYFGSDEEIARDIPTYLTAIKRMLPRWANSLPDSEYFTLIELIEGMGELEEPVFVETGIGASTIALVHYAMQCGGRVISWDMNPSKGSFIRGVCAETLEQYHGKPVADHWTFVGSSSLADHTGLGILGELVSRVDLSIHDSDHTWQTIAGEVEAIVPYYKEGGIVCVDDANQVAQHTYEPIVNMTRKKLGLAPVTLGADNVGEPHYQRLPGLLAQYFDGVDEVSGAFQDYLRDDIYYAWYRADRQGMGQVGMEDFDTVAHRFGAWKLSGRR
jgi:hypothetical protein